MKLQQDGAATGEANKGAGAGWQKSASGKWTSGGEIGSPSTRSMWQQKEEEAQRARVRLMAGPAIRREEKNYARMHCNCRAMARLQSF